MVVVEALLSSLFEVVLDKLMGSPLLDYARRLKVDPTPLQHWKTTLLQIKSVLNDAEQRQIQDDAVVIGWLDDLKALACDIEDVLDEIDTEAQRRSLGQRPQTSSSKVRKLIPSFDYSNFNKRIGKKMNTISEMLDAIVKQKTALGLREGLGVGGVLEYPHEGVGPSVNRERQTTSFVTVPKVYGREADMEKIIKLLLSDEVASAPEVQVMPIVGMGGIGKTTLAQSIYNDKRVEENFQIRGWTCVSDQFHLETVTKQILESVSGGSSDSQNLQLLQMSLQKVLNGKKFFLVLDDVWIENPNTWSELQAPLKGAAGSVILVTTRSERVGSIMRTTPLQPLGELSEEDSWSLFAHISFENTTPYARQNLEPIGRRIIKKCKGLPLAVKTLAGLLRSKQDDKTWEKMLSNEIWDLPLQQCNILPVLRLSYHYLPSALKQCFAYCSIFPKDRDFDKEELILLWAAQGFLGGIALQRGETIKDVGETYFDELLSRSFFQQSGGSNSSFVMHDMIHDLARFVSRNFCLTLDVEGQDKISERTRHISYIHQQFDVSKRFDPLLKTHKLRTFQSLPMSSYWINSNLADKVLHDLLPTFECLRVLSLSFYDITHLPDSFGNLKHLRYLNLSRTGIEKLPQSIYMLLTLQSLVLSNCSRLTELPAEIGKLINLIYLDVSGTKIQGMPVEIGKLVNLLHLDIFNTRIEGMPIGINKLKDLRRLTTFVVGKHSGASIAELRDLSHLQGALSILNLQNVVNAIDALEANLKEKKGLDDLVFDWDPKNVVDGDLNNQTKVLEKLQPHTNVKRLRIQHYNGTEFPKWLGDPSFMNIAFLKLEDCKSCSCLPPLGQLQSLKDLQIVKMKEVRKVGEELYGNYGYGSSSIKPFGSLEILRFEEMLKWEEWVCCGVEFPCLKTLYIENCPKLKGDIPRCLPQSSNIEVSECGQLMYCLLKAPSIRELTLTECDDEVVRSAGGLTSLVSMNMRNVCKIPGELGQLHSLVRLCVDGCPELKEIPPILHNLTSLKHLVINRCESLLSLSEVVLPPILGGLYITSCPILESLPEGMMQNNTTLQNLEIMECEKLELSLGEDMTHNHHASSLTSIIIVNSCRSLMSFPLAFFTKLEHLNIQQCRNLESLYVPDELHHVDLTYLRSLNIYDCPKLVSFPQGGLPAPNLTSLRIYMCNKLKSLPQGMNTLLTSLQELDINRLEIDSFPDGGLPANLSKLFIRNCHKLVNCRMEWALHTLPFLRTLRIGGNNKEQRLEESFLEEERFLPSSLTDLIIWDFPNLKFLHNKGLQHLTTFVISSFPNLKSLDNEFQHLTSLETLQIENCEKLKYLPKQGLPSSLSRLSIGGCPLLKKRCQRDKGKEWPKISHIPCIVFDEYDEKNRVLV